jgi:LuxR family maltose regulon positive regulatory protein
VQVVTQLVAAPGALSPVAGAPAPVVQRKRGTALSPADLVTRTPLAAPQRAPWFTSRPRLLDALDAGQHLPLVLVSASAGTGKSSLVADWLDSRTDGGDTEWATLNAPHDPLWSPVLTALQRLGVEVPPLPDDGSDRLEPAALTTLGAALATRPRPARIVIDGFELAPTQTAEDLDLLLRCAAGGLRLVIVTRVDPALRLYRHRLEGSVLEIRDRDLAFDDEEARLLLERAGLALPPEAIHDLNVRVGGWATGLRFAAQALAAAADPDEAVVDVVANVSDINEYLLGEVLDAQGPEVRRLLMVTSVPDILYPGLVEQLVGPGRMLTHLTRLNAFLEPVSGAPGCYRYHPLFRDLLRAELAYEAPDLLVDAHRRAGSWLVQHSFLDAGVEHLASAGCWEAAAAAAIDHLALERLLLCREDDPLVRTFSTMPEVVASMAAHLVRAGLALGRGRPAECDRLLASAREVVATAPLPREAAADALLDAVRGRDQASPREATALAQRAEVLLEQLGDRVLADHPELVAMVASCRGVAEIRDGRLGAAARTLAGSAATAPDRSVERLHALGYLALVEALEGELSRAADNAALALDEDAVRSTRGVLQSSASEVALAVVSLERLDLDAAEGHLRAAAAVGDTSPVSRGVAAMTEACVQQSKGRLDQALDVVDAARGELSEDDEWLDRQLALGAARLRIAAGSPGEALAGLAAVEQEPEAGVLAAQAHIHEGHPEAAASCLERVREAEVPLHARVLSILVEAAQESSQSSPARTRGLLRQSLRLAETERMRRPFQEASPDVQRLLHHDPDLAPFTAWLGRRTDAPTPAPTATPGARPRAAATGRTGVVHDLLPAESADLPAVIEPLTAKELEVLGLLAELLSTQEIATTMFISVNTVRTHVRNILRKLGVTRRSAAVRRARRLQIV